ncbi:MAG: flagellar biosynthetic protein FliO [Vicinamibacterales bacterium]
MRLLALGQAAAFGADPVLISGRSLAAAVITIGVLAALAWALRRSSLRRTGQPVTVETAIPLGERRSLLIVAVEGRRLLLGVTPGQITLVTELNRPFRDALDDTIGREAAS